MCQGGSQPGNGGISRGRGDAELNFGDETEGATDKFDIEVLPAAGIEDMEASTILGVGRGAPTVEPTAEGAGSGNAKGSVGKAAWKRRLSPSHRDAVRTFFTPSSKQ